MKKGRLVDVGNHKDLMERHKNYSNILSSKKGDNEPIDLDCAEGPLASEAGEKMHEHIVQTLLEDNYLKSLGSSESVASQASSTMYASQSITPKVNSNVTFSEGMKYFLKVQLN